MPGNQRAPDGTLTNVGKGIAGLGLKLGATALGGPALGQLVGKAYGNYQDTGSVLPAFMQQRLGSSDQIGTVTRQPISFPGQVQGGNIGMQPGIIASMPAVQAEQPWTGSLADPNPFGGQYGGNLGLGGSKQFTAGAMNGFGSGGRGGFAMSTNPYAGSLTGEAARGFLSGMKGPTLSYFKKDLM